MAKALAGIHVALLSGFADDGAFDPNRQAAIAPFALAQRIDGLYVGGSSAESAAMTPDELAEQQAVVAEAAAGSGKTLIAHVGVPAQHEAIRLARNAARLGYHGLSALPPHAFAFRFEDVRDYYAAIAAATDLPLVIYEVPARTVRATPADEMGALLSLQGVIGLKFTAANLFELARIQAAHPDKTIFYGMDEMLGAAAALGVDGGIGTTYNIAGGLYRDLFDAAEAGHIATLRRLQRISQELVALILETGVIPGTKRLMARAGVDCGPARLPLRIQSADAAQRLDDWFDRGTLGPWLPASTPPQGRTGQGRSV